MTCKLMVKLSVLYLKNGIEKGKSDLKKSFQTTYRIKKNIK